MKVSPEFFIFVFFLIGIGRVLWHLRLHKEFEGRNLWRALSIFVIPCLVIGTAYAFINSGSRVEYADEQKSKPEEYDLGGESSITMEPKIELSPEDQKIFDANKELFDDKRIIKLLQKHDITLNQEEVIYIIKGVEEYIDENMDWNEDFSFEEKVEEILPHINALIATEELSLNTQGIDSVKEFVG